MRPLAWLVTCEHGGNHIPATYREHFTAHGELLAGHRGWDPGSRHLARALARRLGVPCQLHTISRLLVDANRSLGHRQLFSPHGPSFSRVEKEDIVRRYYRPHRQRVVAAVASRVAAGFRLVHLEIHSFTPILGAARRDFEVGWLYDSRRPEERLLVDELRAALKAARVDLRQRRNAPYLGSADGLTTHLRKTYGADCYLGIELEINQSLPLGAPALWRRFRDDMVEAVAAVASRHL